MKNLFYLSDEVNKKKRHLADSDMQRLLVGISTSDSLRIVAQLCYGGQTPPGPLYNPGPVSERDR